MKKWWLVFILALAGVILFSVTASAYGYYGYCPTFCKNGLYYYSGQAMSTGQCLYQLVQCAEGCDENQCKDVEQKKLRSEIPSTYRAFLRNFGGLSFTDLATRECPDVCYNDGQYYEGTLNPYSGRCTYNWQPCSNGCDRRTAHCSMNGVRPVSTIPSPVLNVQSLGLHPQSRRGGQKSWLITNVGGHSRFERFSSGVN